MLTMVELLQMSVNRCSRGLCYAICRYGQTANARTCYEDLVIIRLLFPQSSPASRGTDGSHDQSVERRTLWVSRDCQLYTYTRSNLTSDPVIEKETRFPNKDFRELRRKNIAKSVGLYATFAQFSGMVCPTESAIVLSLRSIGHQYCYKTHSISPLICPILS